MTRTPLTATYSSQKPLNTSGKTQQSSPAARQRFLPIVLGCTRETAGPWNRCRRRPGTTRDAVTQTRRVWGFPLFGGCSRHGCWSPRLPEKGRGFRGGSDGLTRVRRHCCKTPNRLHKTFEMKATLGRGQGSLTGCRAGGEGGPAACRWGPEPWEPGR